MIGVNGGRESGKPVLAARQEDDVDVPTDYDSVKIKRKDNHWEIITIEVRVSEDQTLLCIKLTNRL